MQRESGSHKFYENIYYKFVPYYCQLCGMLRHKEEVYRRLGVNFSNNVRPRPSYNNQPDDVLEKDNSTIEPTVNVGRECSGNRAAS